MSIVHFIGAGPGDPELITVKGKRLIEECPVMLYAGSLVPAGIVALARPGTLVIDTAPLHLDEIVGHMGGAARREEGGAGAFLAILDLRRHRRADAAPGCALASPMT